MVQPLLPAAQVQRTRRALADDQAEQVDVEALGRCEVEHDELGPGGADDVEGRPRRCRRGEIAGSAHAATPRLLIRAESHPRDVVRAERDVHDLEIAVEVERVVAALAADAASS